MVLQHYGHVLKIFNLVMQPKLLKVVSIVKLQIITIAHRLGTIMDSDRIIVLDAGRISEFGTPWTLLQKEEGLLSWLVSETGPQNAIYLRKLAKAKHDGISLDQLIELMNEANEQEKKDQDNININTPLKKSTKENELSLSSNKNINSSSNSNNNNNNNIAQDNAPTNEETTIPEDDYLSTSSSSSSSSKQSIKITRLL